jgi:hypothetical protein
MDPLAKVTEEAPQFLGDAISELFVQPHMWYRSTNTSSLRRALVASNPSRHIVFYSFVVSLTRTSQYSGRSDFRPRKHY